ncbi:MAG TPA: ribonuclease H family protein [Pseudogracilibacillus sp.]|nr:ribonuclease H family protein [Pseudogracilibacillus sp.]
MAKQKYYVVWKGRNTGIYNSWNECKAETEGFPGALFKSFPTLKEAEEAFIKGSAVHMKQEKDEAQASATTPYIEESISVDAACSGNPGPMEYRGVDTKTGEELFHHGPIASGTNNIGEYLAIVHGLAMLKQQNSNLPIYSDSAIAIGWVAKKGLNTTVARNEATEELWQLIDRATNWLQTNEYDTKIYKWDTANWGEIKADFGRK